VHNPNRDFITKYECGRIVDMDVKTKQFEDDLVSGNLCQIDVVGDDIIAYPRDYNSLNNQWHKLVSF